MSSMSGGAKGYSKKDLIAMHRYLASLFAKDERELDDYLVEVWTPDLSKDQIVRLVEDLKKRTTRTYSFIHLASKE